jgi:uncharacterized protein
MTKNKISGEFQVFVKPVGAVCNFRCSYCYYLKKSEIYSGAEKSVMDDAVLEKYIASHIEAVTNDNIFFSWHGGEPLMAGIEFYKKALVYQKKYNTSAKQIINGIQTNGSLLNDDWCSFLAKEKFVVGISIDGTQKLHDLNRINPSGEGTFSDVVNGYKLLKKYGITAEILCVVNSENVKFPLTVYNFFRELGVEYLTFLPLVERDNSNPGAVTKESVPSEDFGEFLSTIFNEWVENDIGKIKVQIFEEAARVAFGQQHTLCIFKENCGSVPVIEHNGDFYSCDHYVDRKHHLGNIKETSLSDFLESDIQNRFGMFKSESLPEFCIKCEVREMCNGECPKNRFLNTPDGEPGLNYLCAGYMLFFNRCRPFVEAIRQMYLEEKNKS